MPHRPKASESTVRPSFDWLYSNWISFIEPFLLAAFFYPIAVGKARRLGIHLDYNCNILEGFVPRL
jgi:hypothetical protein